MPTNTGCVEHCGFEEKLILGFEDECWDQLSSQSISKYRFDYFNEFGDTALLRTDRHD